MTVRTRPCEICKAIIGAERAEAMPETRLCTEHARMIGKYGGEFLVTTSRESLGKAGSLKKNYGSVSVRMTRNTLALAKLRRDYDESRRAGS